MTVALMWEAKAAPERGGELLTWVEGQQPVASASGSSAAPPPVPSPLRRETFTAPGDRVLVITWWDAPYDADLPELPEPPADLTARPVHRWRFERV